MILAGEDLFDFGKIVDWGLNGIFQCHFQFLMEYGRAGII